MKILILEDEALSALSLRTYLQQWDKQLTLLDTLPSIESFGQWLHVHEMPDLLFSDIELLDGNVFSFLARTPLRCPVIFTTAYDRFMQSAFEYNGIGYLLKPLSYEKVESAMQKYTRLSSCFEKVTPSVWENLQKKFVEHKNNYKQRFVVKAKNGLILLPVETITFFQSDEGLIAAVDEQGRKHYLHETLQSIEEQLDPAIFFRINRSNIINVHYIERIEPYFDDRLAIKIKKQAISLVSSINRTPMFRKWLE